MADHEMLHERLCEALDNLAGNHVSKIIYRRGGRRHVASFDTVYRDLRAVGQRLRFLLPSESDPLISIVGPIGYEWLLLDLACMRAGIKTLAVPETVSGHEYTAILRQENPQLRLVDATLASRISADSQTIYFGTESNVSPMLANVPLAPECPRAATRGPEYTIGFSSGTQGRHRRLLVPYPDLSESEGKLRRRSEHARNVGSADVMLLWTSFSHYLQRWLALQALAFGFDLVLSTPETCLQDVMREKPSFMVSPPALYHALADVVRSELATYSWMRRLAHRGYRAMRLNSLHYSHPVRRFVDTSLFPGLVELYGGNPEQFVWSGACIRQDALEVLNQVGLQVLGGYALSELGPIASDRRETFKPGSSGIPHRSIRIAADGEILVHVNFPVRDSSQLSIDSEGFAHTGDLGYVDQDGHLFVTGRKDDILILATGKNVRPQELETLITASNAIKECFVFTRDNVHLSAVLLFSPVCVASAEAAIREVRRVNGLTRAYERIDEWHIAADPIHGSEVKTPSQKLRRDLLAQHFCDAAFSKVL